MATGHGHDETPHEPAADAAGHDDHGGHGHDDEPKASVIIPENSMWDMLLNLVAVAAGAGLVVMMVIWMMAPIEPETEHAKAPGPQVEEPAKP